MSTKRTNSIITLIIIACGMCFPVPSWSAPASKIRLLVISSYHKEYDWSKDTNLGFCAALRKFGYFENDQQASDYSAHDYLENTKVVVKKLWMDTKRKGSDQEVEATSLILYNEVKAFRPDLLFLGDDNAAKYIGTKFLDTAMPIVFWGVNNTPVKYGLIDNIEKPGHNVTGVYQAGYYRESLQLLKALVPKAQTFAILSVESETGRSHYKAIQRLAKEGQLPLTLADTVVTNDFDTWKKKILELQGKVDAFFVAQYAGIKDTSGNYVPEMQVARWYLENSKIPEAIQQLQHAQHGLFCGADDSGYNQGFEAVVIANDILANGKKPETYKPVAPPRGPLMINKQRAKRLGIKLSEKKLRKELGVEMFLDTSTALSQ